MAFTTAYGVLPFALLIKSEIQPYDSAFPKSALIIGDFRQKFWFCYFFRDSFSLLLTPSQSCLHKLTLSALGQT